MTGPLQGVRILEFSEILAGPFAGMLLADLGAEVIKVEPTSGEPWRHQWGAQVAPGESRGFIALNRGKRDLPVNLRSPQGREIVHRLVPRTDLVIVNYRPDTPANLGIDYPTLAGLNPRLIYVSATAFGTGGPSRGRPGYDLILQAMTGLMAADGKTDEEMLPRPASPAVIDMATGYAIAWSACAALYGRERTGAGQLVEVSMLGAALGLLAAGLVGMPESPASPGSGVAARLRAARAAGAGYQELRRIHEEETGQARRANAYYRCYETRDSVIAVAALSDPLRRKLAAVLGLHDPRLEDPGFPRSGPEADAAALAVLAQARARMRERTTEQWLAAFDAAGVPAGPVRFPEEMLEDPDVVANGLAVELRHAAAGRVRMVGPLLRMSATPPEATRAAPVLGEGAREVLAELGYSEEAIAGLVAAGVVHAPRLPAPA
jgi:CoA:oxalate CoA-transferase